MRILNYALTLEFLEAAFYKQAVANQAFGSGREPQAVCRGRRRSRGAPTSKFLKGALGSKAIKSPKFDFGDTVADQAKFAATAQVLEDTGVSAYLGQVKNVFQPGVLSAAGTIATVEARHAAWIRFINSGGDARSRVVRQAGSPRRRSSARSARPGSSSSLVAHR